jgi:thiamine-phosphate pyrophosphorylase
MVIGVSTHSIAEAKEAETKGADFITYGPVYFTQSKAKYGSPVGLESLSCVCAGVGLPVFALGGVGRDTIEDVISAGAAGVAMISAILAADDVESAAAQIAERVRRSHSSESYTKKEG